MHSQVAVDAVRDHGLAGLEMELPIVKGRAAASAGTRQARREDEGEPAIALAWLLAVSPVTLPIPGTGTRAHLEDNLAAATLHLDDDEVAAITEAVSQP